MKIFIIALVFMLGGIGIVNAQEMCFTPSAKQVEAAQYFTDKWNANPEETTTLTVKQYVEMRLIGSQHSGGVFNMWIKEMNNEKAKNINLKEAYKRSPDSVKDQIKTLLAPYKDG